MTTVSTSHWDFDYYLEEDCSMTFQGVRPNKPKHTFNPQLKSLMDWYIDGMFMGDDYNYEHYEKWGFIKPHFELFEEELIEFDLEDIAEKFSSEIEALQRGITYWIVIPNKKKEANDSFSI